MTRPSTRGGGSSGALAGNPFGIDRENLAADLGFARPTANSIDGVTDRDFVVELCFWASLLMVHLSKFGEDLIVYGTQEVRHLPNMVHLGRWRS